VADQQSGLRFDIYERVHLSEDTAAIRELDEVELVPHIQVYTEEEQALLKGHLYLTGQYEGTDGEAKRTLEHLIPVEITLPLNRIQDVSQVSVNIDNFDVDILSPRSLNVTGVLTLHGIEMLSLPDSAWEEEEETIFVHEAPSYNAPEQREAAVPAEPALVYAEEEIVQEPAYAWAPFLRKPEEGYRAEEPAAEQPQSPAWNAPAEEADEVAEVYVDPTENAELPEWTQAAAENEQLNEVPAQLPALEESAEAGPQEEKKEVKIAFNSKSPSSDTSYHLQSLIHTNPHDYRAAELVEEVLSPTPRTDALEWKRLFSREQEEERRVRQLKVCIVQKEETLEDIASRYGLNPKEIQLYNRLTDGEIAEGKTLLIPV
jgi:stage VI sporulation protein D